MITHANNAGNCPARGANSAVCDAAHAAISLWHISLAVRAINTFNLSRLCSRSFALRHHSLAVALHSHSTEMTTWHYILCKVLCAHSKFSHNIMHVYSVVMLVSGLLRLTSTAYPLQCISVQCWELMLIPGHWNAIRVHLLINKWMSFSGQTKWWAYKFPIAFSWCKVVCHM